ncbi:7845_t:CDS:1, partial [Gigaspora margarita]
PLDYIASLQLSISTIIAQDILNYLRNSLKEFIILRINPFLEYLTQDLYIWFERFEKVTGTNNWNIKKKIYIF